MACNVGMEPASYAFQSVISDITPCLSEYSHFVPECVPLGSARFVLAPSDGE